MDDVAEKLYREDNGCLYVNPVILLIIVLILYLYGNFSLCRMMQGTQIYITYRCFGGYTLDEGLSHISTLRVTHSFTEETVEQVFPWILQEVNVPGI